MKKRKIMKIRKHPLGGLYLTCKGCGPNYIAWMMPHRFNKLPFPHLQDCPFRNKGNQGVIIESVTGTPFVTVWDEEIVIPCINPLMNRGKQFDLDIFQKIYKICQTRCIECALRNVPAKGTKGCKCSNDNTTCVPLGSVMTAKEEEL